jgi:hypothetical protein
MEIIPIPLPEHLLAEEVPGAIEETVIALELELSLYTILKSPRGAMHWHIRRPPQRGTLEITYDANRHQAWFSTRAGRTKDWVLEAMEQIAVGLSGMGVKRRDHGTKVTVL